MKKAIFSIAMLFVAAAFVSCEKDPIGGTATEKMAGQWYVKVDIADDNGKVLYDDPYGLGYMLMLTYNASNNDPNTLWVNDMKNFWTFAVKTKCDLDKMTFSTNGPADNQSGDPITVDIKDGKILLGEGRQPNGSPADSIVFFVKFSDDQDHLNYKISGHTYSGLAEND